MPIKHFKITIKNKAEEKNFNIKGVKTDNSIKYSEDNNTKTIYFINENKLVRDTNELKIELYFSTEKETTGTIYYKKLKKKYYILIKTKIINITKTSINIDYLIENNEFNYRIEEIL